MSLAVHLLPELGEPRPGDVVALTGDEAHHAVAVRRLRVGESVIVTDGRGGRCVGEVVTAERRLLEVRCVSYERLPEPQPRITVVQALAKGDRGELAVELLTELGVAEVVPWAAARSVVVWRGERASKGAARWAATAREAAKQSRRSWFPVIADHADTAAVVRRAAAVSARGGAVWVLHEEAEVALAAKTVPEEVLLVVGPEGGLTEEEVAALTGAGGVAVRLGAEVLRTSTAGAAAAAGVLARSSRWR